MPNHQPKFNVAIDGPAGAGKSTVARMVADKLGFLYIDTGAMYRAVALKCMEAGVDPDETDHIVRLTERLQIKLVPGPDRQQVMVDGTDVTDEIRANGVSQNVSAYASIPQVRELLVAKQKEMAASKGVVMDGRDIASHVLPDAEVKIFLTASVEKRAERRYRELVGTDPSVSLEQIINEIRERDRIDMERKTSPLVISPDAVVLDTSGLSVQEVVDKVLELCRQKTDG